MSAGIIFFLLTIVFYYMIDTENKISCPCCEAKVFSARGKYEICSVCGWEDDPVQLSKPDYVGGANTLSLNQARQEWKKHHKTE